MSENPLTRTQQRILDGSYRIEVEDPKALLFQHTVLCQCAMPYRNPGNNVLAWSRQNGAVSLRIHSGEIRIPGTNRWRYAGVPYGCKPRMLLAFLNGEALRTGSPVVHLEESLRAFLARFELNQGGRTMRAVKDQLTRLAVASVSLAMTYDTDRWRQQTTNIVEGLDLWLERDGTRRTAWPTKVELSPRYFSSLQDHAVPLDDRAIIALANNARALDIYAWLAQRLWRLHRPELLVSWAHLQDQFGGDLVSPRRFRQLFRHTLTLAHSQYPAARLEFVDGGLLLYESPPPVKVRRRPGRLVEKAF
jgi:hypothetical protein